jgi:preprotein translocase subunit SecF
MSDEGFHVHGHHEHELEHGSHQGDKLSQHIAIFTAILATIGAIISYQGGATQNEAMLFKNEAVLKKAQASDQWSFYQAKALKGHLMEIALESAPKERKGFYQEQVAKYNADKKKIQAEAEALDEASKKANEKSEELMHPHHELAQAMTLAQIAISLASITALTRRRWLFGVAAIAAAGSGMLWVTALMS